MDFLITAGSSPVSPPQQSGSQCEWPDSAGRSTHAAQPYQNAGISGVNQGQINPIPKIAPITTTCITSLQHVPVNPPSNNCQSYTPPTERRSSRHHKPKWLNTETHLTAHLDLWADPGRARARDVAWASRILRLKSFLQSQNSLV